MTEEERRIISDYVMRVAGAQPATAPASTPWGGRPTTGQAPTPQLPPVEPEADRLIADLFQRHPEARFRITQTAFVQEHALVAANNRIQELEYQLEGTRRQAESAKSRGIFGFGGRPAAPMPPPPQPQYPPNYNPQALQGRQGSGFLGTAMMTAAGVAGGMVLGNMLMGAIGGGGAAAAAGLGGAAGGTGSFGQEAVPTSSAWTDPGAAASEAGYAGNDASGSYDTAAGNDASGGYDTAGYDDAAGGGYDDGGGFDDA